MSRFMVGNLFLLVSVSAAVSAQILFKALIDEVQPAVLDLATLRRFLEGGRLPRGALASGLLVTGFLFWLLCLARLPLSYAFPVASSSIVLVTLFSVLVLGEPSTPRIWAGTLLVLIGVVLLAPAR